MQMRRREFLYLIVGATTWPLGARAERAEKPPVIGAIFPGTATSTPRIAKILVQRLGELGWVVGRDVVVEYRYAEGSIHRAGEAAAEFARMKVDVILLGGDSEALAAKRATVTIPIVVASVGDPVGNGLIESLAHPGGNITGMSLALSETAGKRLELLREVVPGLKTCRHFWQLGQSPGGYGAECSYSSCARARFRHHYIGGPNYRRYCAHDRGAKRECRRSLCL
jgi:putative ABC transport system substrate-binding protein